MKIWVRWYVVSGLWMLTSILWSSVAHLPLMGGRLHHHRAPMLAVRLDREKASIDMPHRPHPPLPPDPPHWHVAALFIILFATIAACFILIPPLAKYRLDLPGPQLIPEAKADAH